MEAAMSLDNSFRLDGRVAFLSGAAGHLGREMAFALGRAGASLILNGRNAKRLEAFASELGKARIEAECAPFDMMDFAKSRAFFAKLSRLHILINNAVTMTPKAFSDVSADDFDTTYRSAVTAAFEAVRAARPALSKAAAETGDASVINVATMYAGVSPDPKLYNEPGQMSPPHYGAAKAGLVQLTRHLAAELGPSGIRVNAIAPGYIRTDATHALAEDPVRHKQILDRIPAGRWGAPDDLGGAVVFLASKASDYVHGHLLVVDGGWMGR